MEGFQVELGLDSAVGPQPGRPFWQTFHSRSTHDVQHVRGDISFEEYSASCRI